MIAFGIDGLYGTTRETLGLLGQQPDDRNAEQDRDLGIASELLARLQQLASRRPPPRRNSWRHKAPHRDTGNSRSFQAVQMAGDA